MLDLSSSNESLSGSNTAPFAARDKFENLRVASRTFSIQSDSVGGKSALAIHKSSFDQKEASGKQGRMMFQNITESDKKH